MQEYDIEGENTLKHNQQMHLQKGCNMCVSHV